MDPSGEEAKKRRSVMSQTMQRIGFGKWKVVIKDWVARSHN